jgi:hypothetical protein
VKFAGGLGLNFLRYFLAILSVINERSNSEGVPIKSNTDDKTWPSVIGNPSSSIGAFLGLTGKQCEPLSI